MNFAYKGVISLLNLFDYTVSFFSLRILFIKNFFYLFQITVKIPEVVFSQYLTFTSLLILN